MKQAVLSQWDMPWLPIIALLMFVVCFAVYTFWTYRKKNKKFYENVSLIPLEEAVKVLHPSQGNKYE